MSEPSSSRAASEGGLRPTAASLDELIALNDEIAALARAGVPLASGLAGLSGDLPGRLGRITQALAERIGRGESLSAALAHDPQTFPPVYRALVEAGMRCGRLAPVLEGLADSRRKLRDVRQTVFFALLYPLGVMLLAFGLFLVVLLFVLPNLTPVYYRHPPASLLWLDALAARAGIWGPLVPLAIVLVFAAWWYASSRSLVLQNGRSGGALGWLPGVGRMLANSQAAALADILALLLEHGVPLGQAILLAADTVGDHATRDAAESLAATIERGGLPTTDVRRAGGLTPLVRWLIVTGQNERTLVPLVRQTAEVYRQRTLRQADMLRLYLPALLTAGLGGTATLAYALSLFLPFTEMLKELS